MRNFGESLIEAPVILLQAAAAIDVGGGLESVPQAGEIVPLPTQAVLLVVQSLHSNRSLMHDG